MNHSDRISFTLQHVAALLERDSEQVLQERFGIGMSQLKIMKALQTNTRMLQRDIANMLGQTEASISRQMKLLEEDGMVTVRVNARNRRQHVVALTTKGLRLASAAQLGLQSFHAPLYESLSLKQQAELLKLLEILEHQIVSPPPAKHK